MLSVPHMGELLYQTNMGSVGSAVLGTTVTTGGAANTKGTAVELIASTNFDVWGFRVIASNYAAAAAASDGSMDLLIGAATEEIIVADMLYGGAGMSTGANVPHAKTWDFPLGIAAGTRIAVQAAGIRTTTAFEVGIQLWGGTGSPPWKVGGRCITYGMGTVPNGTAITPGASGAQGSWTQITASTTINHFALVPSFQVTNDSTQNLRNIMVGIGLGAATEELIGDGYVFHTSSNESMGGPLRNMPIFKHIPSGSRLTMRASNSGVNDAGYDGVIHAVS